jgi:hypothetical protein
MPDWMLRLPSTRTHFPLIASCSTVVCGLHIVPKAMVGGMTQETTAISDTESCSEQSMSANAKYVQPVS